MKETRYGEIVEISPGIEQVKIRFEDTSALWVPLAKMPKDFKLGETVAVTLNIELDSIRKLEGPSV